MNRPLRYGAWIFSSILAVAGIQVLTAHGSPWMVLPILGGILAWLRLAHATRHDR